MKDPHPRLRAVDLCREFGTPPNALRVVDNVNLEIHAAEFVAIRGPSGSGKSTLLGLLAGLDPPTSGEIFLEGEPLHLQSENELARTRREHVAFVFQSFQLLTNLTAFENVLLPLELNREADGPRKARELLGAIGLGDRLDHYPIQLSGGEQQRVAVARAYAARPKVLFADEPTGNLDSKTGDKVLELILELKESAGTSIVLVTHDESVAQRADRCLRMHDGRLQTT